MKKKKTQAYSKCRIYMYNHNDFKGYYIEVPVLATHQFMGEMYSVHYAHDVDNKIKVTHMETGACVYEGGASLGSGVIWDNAKIFLENKGKALRYAIINFKINYCRELNYIDLFKLGLV